ncbi:hypothetical protein [Mesorhizobium sp. M0276]|uniref:hypothetical protein n=1 Tax=Mesorhizobium sp. M0276 TaxID=2956928 RepID=UPI003337C75F
MRVLLIDVSISPSAKSASKQGVTRHTDIESVMNRNARRAAQAQARTRTIDRITAVHEAGHAVGRLLTAEDMGVPFDQAVHSIEIGAGPSWRSADGRIVLDSEAICYGPAVSRELQVAYRQAYPGCEPISVDELNARLLNIGTAPNSEPFQRVQR